MYYDIKGLNAALAENSKRTEAALAEFFSQKNTDGSLKLINEAQTYSLMGGGKRIRPFLVNEVCRMLGGSIEASMPFAMAIEMVHTYSLIHDDLPCMDNDDMRRGRPTNHKVYGEANAVLAGDALLTNAFLAAASGEAVAPSITARAVALLASAAGDEGMIGGQVTDIEGENKRLSLEELLTLHSLKTGKLIEASAALGALAAGYDESTAEYSEVCAYARGIGLAFQAIDDILDVAGDEATVGKTLASDADNNKTTFLSFFSIEETREYARSITEEALSHICDLPGSELLAALGQQLLTREK